MCRVYSWVSQSSQGPLRPLQDPGGTFAEVVPRPLHGILEIAISEVGVITEATVQANGVGEEHNASAAYNFLWVGLGKSTGKCTHIGMNPEVILLEALSSSNELETQMLIAFFQC